jgi:hypothetical protein
MPSRDRVFREHLSALQFAACKPGLSPGVVLRFPLRLRLGFVGVRSICELIAAVTEQIRGRMSCR